MLNLEIVRVAEGIPPKQDSLVASIQITGGWIGTVVLGFCPAVARAAAIAMLGIVDEEVTQSDMQDVAAELVNMVGGNLKSLLPGPSHLSLPMVTAGREFGVRVHDAQLIDDLWFGSDSGFVRIRLYEKVAS